MAPWVPFRSQVADPVPVIPLPSLGSSSSVAWASPALPASFTPGCPCRPDPRPNSSAGLSLLSPLARIPPAPAPLSSSVSSWLRRRPSPLPGFPPPLPRPQPRRRSRCCPDEGEAAKGRRGWTGQPRSSRPRSPAPRPHGALPEDPGEAEGCWAPPSLPPHRPPSSSRPAAAAALGPMLPRSWRHLLDGGGEDGVTLSAFRARTPEQERGAGQAEQSPVVLREEAEEGAIYTVSSRSPGGARSSGAPGGEAAAASGGLAAPAAHSVAPAAQSRVLKAGTLPRLARHLLEAPALGDASYVPAFLATYRTFASPAEVLRLLMGRLQAVAGTDMVPNTVPETAELRRTLGSLLCSWLSGYPEDFAGLEADLRDRLLTWLRWALGARSEHEKTLLVPPSGGKGSGTKGLPEAGEDEGEPDPHYILGLQAEDVAAHLTVRDAELFLRLVPHECLGSLWSQRDKKGHEGACPTVRATVAQFNCVANAVVASCLGDTELRASQRARLLEKWIRVAEECLCLRNFSALYAIVSALQSTPLHRLKRTWEETARDSLRCYEELSTICSEADNYSQSRRLLFQEVYSQGAGTDPIQRRQQRRPAEQRQMGVVPYLGTFLKDLVMLDAATRNRLQNGYINFEKHRKEFEILTQLRLLQASCRNYTLTADGSLQQWLQRLPRLNETQSYRLSCSIEPPTDGGTPARPPKPSLVITHCTDLLTSVGMSSFITWDQPCSPQTPLDPLPPPGASLSPQGQPGLGQTKWPSVSSLLATPSSSSPGGLAPPPPASGGGFIRGHRRSASCGSVFPASECRIVRVRMALQDGALYKSILVTSQDKTPAIIGKVLEKHNQDLSLAASYELVQLLPEGRELTLPPTANVFYAMSSSCQDFMLRLKGPQEKPVQPQLPPPPRSPTPRRLEISATFPKIKATGRKIAKALF